MVEGNFNYISLTPPLTCGLEDNFNYISLTPPLTCGLEIFERPNQWKLILIWGGNDNAGA